MKSRSSCGKKNLLDYEAKKPADHLSRSIIRNTFSLKGLSPGEYEYDIILRDENDPDHPATQSLKFRVIPAVPPRTEKNEK